MALALALQRVWKDGPNVMREYKCTLSATYTNAANGGETANLRTATNPNNQPNPIPARVPLGWKVDNMPIGYKMTFVPGTTTANGYVIIEQSNSSATVLAELSNGGSYSAAAVADTNIRLTLRSNALCG